MLSLAAEAVELPMFEVLMRERLFVQGLTSVRGTDAVPRPASWTKEVTHEASGPAFTYAFRFGKRNVWKIGWVAGCGHPGTTSRGGYARTLGRDDRMLAF